MDIWAIYYTLIPSFQENATTLFAMTRYVRPNTEGVWIVFFNHFMKIWEFCLLNTEVGQKFISFCVQLLYFIKQNAVKFSWCGPEKESRPLQSPLLFRPVRSYFLLVFFWSNNPVPLEIVKIDFQVIFAASCFYFSAILQTMHLTLWSAIFRILNA